MVSAMIAPLLVLLAAAQAAAAPAPSDPIAADWKPIPDDELMVMTLGDGHRVVIRLASAYAPEPVANLKRLAKARWWEDRKSVVWGKSVSVSVDSGGRRIIKKKKNNKYTFFNQT